MQENELTDFKEKEFYNKIGKIIGWDFSNVKYDVVDDSEFKYFDEINKNILEDTVLLDIGTGGGEKLFKYISNNCLLKIGTDFSEEMIKSAKSNYENEKLKFYEMDSKNLDFHDRYFDIICARHTPFNANEVYRLLKDNGKFFSEQIDEDDCKELKDLFKRGQGYQATIKQREIDRKNLEEQNFSNITFYDIIQEEYYKTEEDLLFLLNNTPIIPNFGQDADDYKKFNEYVSKNTTEKGILLKRVLYGIIVSK